VRSEHHVQGSSFGIVLLCSILLCVGLLWPSHGTVLNYDEADYAAAGKLGVLANALETGSMSPEAFLKFGVGKVRKEPVQLPVGYEESNDPFLLRHLHPPFVTYIVSLSSINTTERTLRISQMLGAIAFIIACMFCYCSIFNTSTWCGLLIVSSLALWCVQLLFRNLSFHGWEAVWIVTTATCLRLWLDRPDSVQRSVALCLSIALAILTLETGLLLPIAAVICMVLWRNRNIYVQIPWLRITQIALATIAIVLLLWPGGASKATWLKIPAMYLYRFKLGEEYAGVGDVLQTILIELAPVVVLMIPALIWLFVKERDSINRWGPLAVVSLVYGLGIGHFVLRIDYILPAFAPLIPLVAAGADRLPGVSTRAVYAAMIVLLCVIKMPSPWVMSADMTARADIEWLGRTIGERRAYIGGHELAHYLANEHKNITLDPMEDGLKIREDGAYRLLRAEEISGSLFAVPKHWDSRITGMASAALENCMRVERPTLIIWDCNHPSEQHAD
jgi:hypothetical protein